MSSKAALGEAHASVPDTRKRVFGTLILRTFAAKNLFIYPHTFGIHIGGWPPLGLTKIPRSVPEALRTTMSMIEEGELDICILNFSFLYPDVFRETSVHEGRLPPLL